MTFVCVRAVYMETEIVLEGRHKDIKREENE